MNLFRRRKRPKQWETVVNISDLYMNFREAEIGVREVAKGFAARLKKNKYAEALAKQIKYLEDISEGRIAMGFDVVDIFDEVLCDLYEFGDKEKRIFFDTYDKSPPRNVRNLLGEDHNKPLRVPLVQEKMRGPSTATTRKDSRP